jgi:oligosaccharide repeat unit polymerase
MFPARDLIGITLSVPESAVLLLGLTAIVVALFGVTLLRPDLDAYFLSFTVLTVLLSVPLVIGCVTRQMDPFNPTTVIAASYFLYFVYAPIRNLIAGQYYFFGKLIMPLLPLGSVYLAFGFIALWAGYYASRMARYAVGLMPSPPEPRSGILVYAWVVAAIAVIAFTVYARLAGLSWVQLLTLGQLGSARKAMQDGAASLSGDFGNYLYSTLDWLTSALLLFYVFARRGRKWLVVMFVALFVVYTTIGFRFRIVILVLAPIVYYYLKRGTRPNSLRVSIVAIVSIFLIGTIGMARGSFRAGERVDPQSISIASSGSTFSNDLNVYQGYLAMIDAIPREHQYLWGSSFAYLVFQPIPRSLWPGKPQAPVLTIINAILGSEAVTAGIAYPNVGEFYANFGALGIVGGMWLFGFLSRVLYEYLVAYRDNEWARIVYALMFPFIIQVISRGYFVQIFQEAAFLLMPIVGGVWLSRRVHRVSARGPVGTVPA